MEEGQQSEQSGAYDIHTNTRPIWQDYQKMDLLGVGGMSDNVMLAIHRNTGKKVAVKTLSREGLPLRARINMHREIQTQSSLAHPGLARLEAVYKSKKHIRLVVEYLEGGSLFEYLKEKQRLSEAETRDLILQLLSAIHHMHSHGVVHRDIKLENIVFSDWQREQVKIIDFGLSTFWSQDMEPMKRECGTPGYAAPEVGRSRYTNKVDMWTVGMVTYIMLTGEVPRWIYDSHGRRSGFLRAPKLALHSSAAQRFVAQLLSVDPEARLSAAEALGHEWMQSGNAGESAPYTLRPMPILASPGSSQGRVKGNLSKSLSLKVLFCDAEEAEPRRSGGRRSLWQRAKAAASAAFRGRGTARVAAQASIVPAHAEQGPSGPK